MLITLEALRALGGRACVAVGKRFRKAEEVEANKQEQVTEEMYFARGFVTTMNGNRERVESCYMRIEKGKMKGWELR